jgi:hypothetical protein
MPILVISESEYDQFPNQSELARLCLLLSRFEYKFWLTLLFRTITQLKYAILLQWGVKKMRKVFRNHDNTAAFLCPGCKMTKMENVTQYIGYENKVRIRCRCHCGVSFTVFLERRRSRRKHANLFGTFVGVKNGSKLSEQMLIVRDISCKGMRLARYSKKPLPYSHGDEFRIKLYLDDSFKKAVYARVKIRNSDGDFIGAELRSVENGWNLEHFWRTQL